MASIAEGRARDGFGNGNVASTSADATVLYDPSPPAVPIAPDLTAATDTSAPSLIATNGRADDITRSETLTFTSAEAVPATTLPADTAGGSVRLYRSTTATGASDPAQPVAIAEIVGGGYTLSDPGSAGLADGTYHYSVRLLDRAGNTSAESPRLAVTLDRSAPVPSMAYTRSIVTLVPLLGSVTVAGTAPHAPGDLLPLDIRVCSGSSTGCATASTATVMADASTGSYSYTTGSLLGGILSSSTAQVSQYDRAGNRGSSAPVTLPGLLG
ncbi:Ig-like domain-containing protein [Arenivirga flava]|uniref:Bacterial Ig-like domain-containing protein n=1 Tax=Arenivirga flava TaxID=1930060 RepID=A0AA37UIJ1_9MICO|nr:Ig-like domain-containing protein [Arenivirga flava]GMA28376.1 hypothetical protein GCM10025874_16290 [Arenivirga flava]